MDTDTHWITTHAPKTRAGRIAYWTKRRNITGIHVVDLAKKALINGDAANAQYMEYWSAHHKLAVSKLKELEGAE